MSAWEKSSHIAKSQINRRGMQGTVTAVQICQYAEQISSVPFTAVSFRNGTLKIRMRRDRFLDMKMVQGSLIENLNEYATANKLAPVRRLFIDIEQ